MCLRQTPKAAAPVAGSVNEACFSDSKKVNEAAAAAQWVVSSTSI